MSSHIRRIYGVNIAVRDLSASTELFEKVFNIPAKPVDESGFAFPHLRGSRFDVHGFIINLITSDDPSTSVSSFLEKNGDGVFLLSLEVGDIDGAEQEVRDHGLSPLLPAPARGDFGAVNFIHPKEFAGVQIELFELP